MKRSCWIEHLTRLAAPVLRHASEGSLKAQMPVEAQSGLRDDRAGFTHLEAVGRLLAGLAPWLTTDAPTEIADQSRAAIAAITDPSSPDHCNFSLGHQPVVDAAFLAQALLRAPGQLIDVATEAERLQIRGALEQTRVIRPFFNNWLLFAAIIEAAIHRLGGQADPMRIDYALRQHEQWYKGDGVYGDGPDFHWDYYNSYVIQPMLLAVLDVCADWNADWQGLQERVVARAQRYADVQERLIHTDGSFPIIGRSIAYRCGAFQHLADCALRGLLPEAVSPSQVRGALGAVIERTLSPAGTYDDDGWLRIGINGSQLAIGENYISTGSLYLAATAFLPLGLPVDDVFWTGPEEPWTARRIWDLGENLPCDHAFY